MNQIYEGKRLLSLQEVCNYTGLGPTKARTWAIKIGAARHIGRRALFDRVIIDRAIDKAGKPGSQ